MLNWQRDPKWVNTKLGFSDSTIGDDGCVISVIGNIIGVDPTIINDRLKAVNGFYQGNLVIWGKIQEAFPGIIINRFWTYNNDDVKANVPNVIVEVPAIPIGGIGSHWVQYLGNQQLADPWTGTVRPTSDFPNPTGYCVITGKWNLPSVPTEPMVTSTQAELDAIRLARDQHYNDLQAANKTIASLNDLTKQKDNEIARITSQAGSLTDQVKNLTDQVNTLKEQAVKVPQLTEQLSQAENDRKICLNAQGDTNKLIANLKAQIEAGKPKTFIDRLYFLLGVVRQ